MAKKSANHPRTPLVGTASMPSVARETTIIAAAAVKRLQQQQQQQ